MKCWEPIEPALDSSSKSNERRRKRRTKQDQMVARSLNIITVINGIVQVEEDIERQGTIFNRNAAFSNLINNLKKKNSPNSDVQTLIKNKLTVRAKEY